MGGYIIENSGKSRGDVKPSINEKPKKKLWVVLIIAALLAIGFSSLINPLMKAERVKVSTNSSASSSFVESYSSANSSTASSSTAQEVTSGTISYGEYKSRTSGTDELVVKTATVRSTGSIRLGVPYTGDNFGHLSVRKTGDTTDIIFSVDKGKINSSPSKPGIKVTFDNDKTLSFSGIVTTKDRSSSILFSDSKFFLQKLKNTRKLVIEVDFYPERGKMCEFDVSGLDLSKIGL